MYTSHFLFKGSEDAFSEVLVKPFVNIVARNLEPEDCKAGFFKGQPILESMTSQLKLQKVFVDLKSQYKNDGLVKLFGLKEIGVFLRLCFDNHKGMFGGVAMLKSIVDHYSCASIESFENVKVFFLNAVGKQLHLWSLSFKINRIFDMWIEGSLLLIPDFSENDDFVPDLAQFCWNMKAKRFIIKKAEYRYSSSMPVVLTDVINPTLYKLT
ncbi:hypothetical protein F4703DRAFT_1910643 [Phycomyces blakesleeanus]